LNASYEMLRRILQFGPADVTSNLRRSDVSGYHRINGAIDFVPANKIMNIIIFYLFWPGGMGVDFSEGNFHIHIDEGPYRRWIE